MPTDRLPSHTLISDDLSGFVYQCVCGESVTVTSVAEFTCPKCGRHIRDEALKLQGAATMHAVDVRRLRSDADGNAVATTPQAAETEGSSTDSLIGQRLGYFRIISSIGRGGMGEVYCALDESLQRYVALKVIHTPDKSLEGGTVQHLLQEARAQARVHHQNVVTIYYVGKQKETPFLAMELVAGDTLAERMKKRRISFGEMVDIAIQVASALKMAAQIDMVHGDIKPGNILIAEDGTIKLSDFGLARQITPKPSQSSKISGTPSYLAPEACRGLPTDSRSDMYALGVLLFEMTFRRYPYTLLDSTLQNCLYAHMRASPEFPDPWPADLPERWRDILARLLAKEPDARFASYGDLINDLEAVRPIDLPKSGRLLRSLAWVVDLLLIFSVQSLLYVPFLPETNLALVQNSTLLRIIGSVSMALAPLAFAWLQVRWLTSPGKKLFQIRIVDRYGLSPGKGVLFARAFIQSALLWVVVLGRVTGAFNALPLGRLIGFIAGLCIIIDAGTAFLRKDGRSLHDLFFGTQVVLDAPPRAQ